MRNILSVEKIEKYYGSKGNVTKAIDNISFNVDMGEFIGIMGPSGSGKTTLLNCMATIDKVTTGKIIINNKEITRLSSKELENIRKNELGFIFQDYNLLDTLTAYENIALALTIKGEKSSEIDGEIRSVAKYLEIEKVLEKYPYEMSGGEKQRVASARAIVTSPSLVLADEPTGALDSKAARLLLEKFECLNKELNTTILMVTHDSFTASYAHRIFFIKDGKIFSELVRGTDSRKEFFNKIIEVVSLLGGDDNNVF
ncbi:ABC transporter ATP-binding protein [Clostridium sp. LIBA-8841]|uniref:ABC transporter ATP-binding protein n=1 Tax=Clostridium sp. LIBA-8841 TaxID=2987530 RepID=UPI002AC7DC8A|nr:ABC transporter ATP-binding protein [Clostridium sp. LIBA-8841]MDZ5254054.1 ABC transporter ATP-binding protein [Clostridium sp. LIBA-8841]